MRGLTRHFARLRRDQRGVSAVEFALIAPIMILFYFGLAETTQVMMAERKTIKTASAIGDLVAQYSTLTPAAVDDIMELGDTLMQPFDTGDQLQVCIASIVADKDNNLSIGWSRSEGDPPCPTEDTAAEEIEAPDDLLSANQSLIMARVTYAYVGPTNMVVDVSPTFTKTFYLRPRKSQTVLCATC